MTAAYHLRRLGHEVVVYESSPLPGGMMRYGIPAYRLPREGGGGRDRPHRRLGVEIECGRRSTTSSRPRVRGVRRRLPGRGRPARAARRHPGRGFGRILDAVDLLRDPREPRRHRWAAGDRLRRRRHRDGRRSHRPPPGRGGDRRRLPADQGTDAGQPRRGAGRGGRRGPPRVARHHRRRRRREIDHRAHGARRRASPGPPASSKSCGPTRWCWRWARRPISRCWRPCPT